MSKSVEHLRVVNELARNGGFELLLNMAEN